VQELASRPATQLKAMARRAWEFARAHHTREAFAEQYRETVEQLIRDFGKGPGSSSNHQQRSLSGVQ
jgi:hypothetical protein